MRSLSVAPLGMADCVELLFTHKPFDVRHQHRSICKSAHLRSVSRTAGRLSSRMTAGWLVSQPIAGRGVAPRSPGYEPGRATGPKPPAKFQSSSFTSHAHRSATGITKTKSQTENRMAMASQSGIKRPPLIHQLSSCPLVDE